MVVKTLNEDSLSKITFDDEKSLLTMIWKEATRDMIGPHFQGSLYMFAGYALQKKPKRILIDNLKFFFYPPEYNELIGPWRTQNISPLYNKSDVKKFAFLFPVGARVPTVEEQQWPGENYLTRMFTSESEMIKWIDS